jgi:hypothetical protein
MLLTNLHPIRRSWRRRLPDRLFVLLAVLAALILGALAGSGIDLGSQLARNTRPLLMAPVPR